MYTMYISFVYTVHICLLLSLGSFFNKPTKQTVLTNLKICNLAETNWRTTGSWASLCTQIHCTTVQNNIHSQPHLDHDPHVLHVFWQNVTLSVCLCVRGKQWRKSGLSPTLSLYFLLLLDSPPISHSPLLLHLSLIYYPTFGQPLSCNPQHSPFPPEFLPMFSSCAHSRPAKVSWLNSSMQVKPCNQNIVGLQLSQFRVGLITWM